MADATDLIIIIIIIYIIEKQGTEYIITNHK